jgi:hypothetical protein
MPNERKGIIIEKLAEKFTGNYESVEFEGS